MLVIYSFVMLHVWVAQLVKEINNY